MSKDTNGGPERITLSRAKGWKMPENTVKVDRTTPFGNPFGIEKGALSGGGKPVQHGYFVAGTFRLFERREDAQRATVDAFAKWVREWPQHKLRTAVEFSLRGKNLACWCKIISHGVYTPCHADVLLELANAPASSGDTLGDLAARITPENAHPLMLEDR